MDPVINSNKPTKCIVLPKSALQNMKIITNLDDIKLNSNSISKPPNINKENSTLSPLSSSSSSLSSPSTGMKSAPKILLKPGQKLNLVNFNQESMKIMSNKSEITSAEKQQIPVQTVVTTQSSIINSKTGKPYKIVSVSNKNIKNIINNKNSINHQIKSMKPIENNETETFRAVDINNTIKVSTPNITQQINNNKVSNSTVEKQQNVQKVLLFKQPVELNKKNVLNESNKVTSNKSEMKEQSTVHKRSKRAHEEDPGTVKQVKLTKFNTLHAIHTESEVLKKKFVPLVGYACTATIIENINMAFSRCRETHLNAIRDLIQYVDNFIKYKTMKEKNSSKITDVSVNRSSCNFNKTIETQTNSINLISTFTQTDTIDKVIDSANKYIQTNNSKLKSGVNINEQTPMVNTLKETISMNMIGKLALFKVWKKATEPDYLGNMPIHNAVLSDDLNDLKRQTIILKRKDSVNIQNELEMTALHLAVMENSRKEIIDYLLQNGADPSIQDKNGNTCVHLAVSHSNVNMIKLLLGSEGNTFDLDSTNYDGLTPLMLCAEYNKPDIAEYLLSKFANPNAINPKTGRTALFMAVIRNRVKLVELLIERGADSRKKDYSGVTAYDALSEIDVNPNIRVVMYRMVSQSIVTQQRKRHYEMQQYEAGNLNQLIKKGKINPKGTLISIVKKPILKDV